MKDHTMLKEFMDNQIYVLNSLEHDLLVGGLQAEVFDKSDAGFADTLIVEHLELGNIEEDIVGQYFFLPESNEIPTYHFFCISMVLTDQLNYAVSDVLVQAIARINNVLPKGAFFAGAEEGNLIFRHTATMPAGYTKEQMLEMAKNEMITCLIYVSLWIDILFALNEGEANMQEFDAYYKKRYDQK